MVALDSFVGRLLGRSVGRWLVDWSVGRSVVGSLLARFARLLEGGLSSSIEEMFLLRN